MATTGMSQKEYLKKYLSGNDDKKKKKKKQKLKTAVNRMKIVDDDIDISTMRSLDDTELELYELQEDAPQIAGIIDERPEEVRNKEKFASKKWRVVADENDAGVKIIDKSFSNISSNEKKGKVDDDNDISLSRNTKDSSKNNTSNHNSVDVPFTRKEKSYDSDESPPRKQHRESDYVSSLKDKVIDSDESPPRKSKKSNLEYLKKKYDSDDSPRRRSKRDDFESKHLNKSKYKANEILSPSRKSKQNNFENANKSSYKDDSDESPPRKSKNHNSEESLKYSHKEDSDESPPRKNKRSTKQNTFTSKEKTDSDEFLVRQNQERHHQINQKYDSDESPPRKSKRDSDYSRKRMQHSDSDESPPRRGKYKDVGLFSKNENQNRSKSKWKDASPTGQRRRGSPVRNRDRIDHSKVSPTRSDSDESPPRRNQKRSVSPPNRGKKRDSVSPQQKHYKRKSSRSPQHRNRKGIESGECSREAYKSTDHYNSKLHDRDYSKNKSLSRHFKDSSSFQTVSDRNDHKKDSRSLSTHKRQGNDRSPEQSREISKNDKRRQTMDGRKAGLVEAGELKAEIADLRQKEKSVFQNMDPSISGKGAAPVMRDRKTGKKRDLEEEARIEKEKDEKQAERDAKYAQWGKGLKQVSDQEKKLKEALYEMSKPLARYADDEDLDKFLREQEREGDPMLAYIKSKNKTEDEKGKPQYEGSYMPNRYGIRPGHRWDGVDRSNGYEKQWFEAQNSRKAVEEEAYKWSTSDM